MERNSDINGDNIAWAHYHGANQATEIVIGKFEALLRKYNNENSNNSTPDEKVKITPNRDVTIFIDVDFEEFEPETYRGVRVSVYKNQQSIELFRSNSMKIVDTFPGAGKERDALFNRDLIKATDWIAEVYGTDFPYMRLSGFDHFTTDADIDLDGTREDS